jgi:transcriptional regulator with XRE-family HTH domain
MKLAEYLTAKNIKRGDFAREIGVTGGWVTCLCDGSGWPSQAVAERIAAATGGDVTANDFTSSPSQAPEQCDDELQAHAYQRAASDSIHPHSSPDVARETTPLAPDAADTERVG